MHKQRTLWALVALLLVVPSCVGGGYDLQRYQNDKAHLRLLQIVSGRWLGGTPPQPSDHVEIPKAIIEWEARLAADAEVLGVAK